MNGILLSGVFLTRKNLVTGEPVMEPIAGFIIFGVSIVAIYPHS